MKRFRAEVAPFVLSLTVALLQAAEATETGASHKALKSGEWELIGGSSSSRRSAKEEELLRNILPLVTFNCAGKTGYFPDAKFRCEVFHYCKKDGTRDTYHCPKNSLFNQLTLSCEEKNDLNLKICSQGSIVPDGRSWSSQKIRISSGSSRTEQKPTSKRDNGRIHAVDDGSGKDHTVNNVTGAQVLKLEDLLSFMTSTGQKPDAKTAASRDFRRVPTNAHNKQLSPTSGAVAVTRGNVEPNASTESSSVEDVVSSETKDIQANAKPEEVKTSVSSSVTISDITGSGSDEKPVTQPQSGKRKVRQHVKKGKVFDLDPSESRVRETRRSVPSSTTKNPKARSSSSRRNLTSSNPPDNDEQNDTHKPRRPKLFGLPERNRPKGFTSGRTRQRKTFGASAPTPSSTESLRLKSTTAGDEHITDSDVTSKLRISTASVPDSTMEPDEVRYTVKPYKLPPLPESLFDLNVDASSNEEIRDSTGISRTSMANPWFKTTKSLPKDVGGGGGGGKYDFGDRASVEYDSTEAYYGDERGSKAPSDIFGGKTMPDESEEGSIESEATVYRRKVMEKVKKHHKHDRHSSKDRRPSSSSKRSRTRDRDTWFDDYRSAEVGDENPKYVDDGLFEDIFPPPRAKQSSHKRKRKKQSPRKRPVEEVLDTSEDEYRETTPYKDRYYSNVKAIDDIENSRWTVSDSEKNGGKIKVGSSVDNQKETGENHDSRDALRNLMKELALASGVQSSADTRGPGRTKVSQIPKNTAAHQQLTKLVNEFFSKGPQAKLKNPESTAAIFIPKYRIPDEDIYDAAEAAAKEVDGLPQEVLDIVKLITGKSEGQKAEKKEKNEGTRVTKVDAPLKDIIGDDLVKLVSEIKGGANLEESQTLESIIKKLITQSDDNDADGSENEDEKEASEEHEDLKKVAELAGFTSLRLDPILKSVKSVLSSKKAIHAVPLTLGKSNVRVAALKPKASNNVPIRVIYRGSAIRSGSSTAPKPVLATHSGSNFKLVRSMLPRPNVQVIHNNRMVPSSNSQFVVLHPPSLVPPHPPPLPHKTQPVMTKQYPHPAAVRPLYPRFPFRQHRTKRSLVKRTKRQIHYNSNSNPLYNPFVKQFNPGLGSSLRTLRNTLVSPARGFLNTAGSQHRAYAYPVTPPPHISHSGRSHFLPRRPLYSPHQPNPQQTLIKEVPLHISSHHHQLPQVSYGHSPYYGPQPSGSVVQRRPNVVVGNRRPPPIQRPPLVPHSQIYNSYPYPNEGHIISTIHHPQHRQVRQQFLSPTVSSVQHIPSLHNAYHNEAFSTPLSVTPLNIPAVYNKPRHQNQAVIRKPPVYGYSPYSLVNPVHTEGRSQFTTPGYPNQGVQTIHGGIGDNLNILANHEPGIIMHSGYKPPKSYKPVIKPFDQQKPHSPPSSASTVGYAEVSYQDVYRPPTSTSDVIEPSTLPPPPPPPSPTARQSTRSSTDGRPRGRTNYSGDRSISYARPSPHENDPSYSYQHVKPQIPYSYGTPPAVVRYKEEPFKPMLNAGARSKAESTPTPTVPSKRPSYAYRTPTPVTQAVTRKVRPTRRRRPRPKLTYHQSSVSPVPPPPQQIPPPPADFTPSSFTNEVSNSISQPSLGLNPEGSQHSYQPAGFYSRDQSPRNVVRQSEKSHSNVQSRHTSSGAQAVHPKSQGPSSPDSTELVGGGSEPVFGARIRSKSGRNSGVKKRVSPLLPDIPDSEVRQQAKTGNTQSTAPKPQLPATRRPEKEKNIPGPGQARRRRPSSEQPQGQKQQRASGQGRESGPQTTTPFPKPFTPSPDFFHVPSGLGGVVAPEKPLKPGQDVPRDMFGIPIPFGEQDSFPGFRPPGGHRGFFSVPTHVMRQQLAPLQKESPFFSATEYSTPPTTTKAPQKRKVVKGRRRKRIKVKTGERGQQRQRRPENDGTESKKKPTEEPRPSTVKYHEDERQSQHKPSTPVTPYTEYQTPPPQNNVDHHRREYKPQREERKEAIPASLEEVSKSLMEGKLDIRKLNATISTSVSVSANGNGTASFYQQPKKVFSSKNGGLAVVKKTPRNRKRERSQSSGRDGLTHASSLRDDEKLQIASSILDIIKATTEQVEKQSTSTDNNPHSSAKAPKSWILKPSGDDVLSKAR